jgi:RHS repeat-associated protein
MNRMTDIYYILKDNLGSWTTIIDSEGNVEQELSFDAWGNLRDPETWTGTVTDSPMFDRGYTGHEHITGFGLINMNGRCYDPLTSAFLSVDAYVQDPASAQAFNRYAYCSHNPLRFTDPTGWYQQPGTYGINLNFNPGGHTTYHSDDPNDMLWGKTSHPHANSSSGCVNGNSVTKTEYTQGNDGSHGSNYTVDRKGYVKNVGENNLTYDVLYTADAYAAGDFSNGLVVYDLSLLSGLMEDRSMYWLWTGNGQGHSGHYSSTEYIDDAFMVFHYMAINTDVEWEISGYRTNGPNEYVIATTHSINSTRTVSSLDQYSVYNQIFEIHNHPDIDGTKGGSWVDVKNINKIHQTDFNSQDIHHWFIHNGQSTIFPKHYVYHNHSSVLYYYLPDGRNDIYIRKINTYKDLYQNLGF